MTTNSLSDLLNLGPKSAQWLQEIGVTTKEELAEMGVVEAYCLVKARHDNATLNLLYALYGALHGLRWNEVPPEVKVALQEDVASFQFGVG